MNTTKTDKVKAGERTQEIVTKPDSLGLSYRISADGNIDIAGYKKPKGKRKSALHEELEMKATRCTMAALYINNGKHFKATEDKDLCCVNVTIPNWDDLEITLSPDKSPQETIIDIYWTDAWRLWIAEDDMGVMSLPAAIARIQRWIVERDLADETRMIFDTYQNA